MTKYNKERAKVQGNKTKVNDFATPRAQRGAGFRRFHRRTFRDERGYAKAEIVIAAFVVLELVSITVLTAVVAFFTFVLWRAADGDPEIEAQLLCIAIILIGFAVISYTFLKYMYGSRRLTAPEREVFDLAADESQLDGPDPDIHNPSDTPACVNLGLAELSILMLALERVFLPRFEQTMQEHQRAYRAHILKQLRRDFDSVGYWYNVDNPKNLVCVRVYGHPGFNVGLTSHDVKLVLDAIHLSLHGANPKDAYDKTAQSTKDEFSALHKRFYDNPACPRDFLYSTDSGGLR